MFRFWYKDDDGTWVRTWKSFDYDQVRYSLSQGKIAPGEYIIYEG